MPCRRLRPPVPFLAVLAVSLPYTAQAEAPSGAASAGGAIEEIVVTARKRTESLQDTPVAVTALTADQIAEFGVQSLADISKMTAGLLFDSEFTRGANRPVIRGQANILGASGVSYFIDGVYVSGSIDDYDLDDIERIEIVKGPQSALYGRNTYSGAINIVTRSAGDEFRATVKGEAAEDGQYLVRASLSGPIGETLAGGLTLRHYEMGGHVTNQYDGKDIGMQESRSVSGVLEFTPNERLSMRGRAYWSERDDGQPAIFASRYFDNNCYPDDGALYGGAGRYFCGTVEPGAVDTDWSVQAPGAGLADDVLQLSFKVDYQLSNTWDLTYIAGYGERDLAEVYDGDYLPTSFQVSNFTPNGFPFGGFADGPPFLYAYVGSMTDFTFANDTTTDDFSHELQLAFDSGRVRGLLGAYYFSQESTSRDIREVSAAQQGIAGANWFTEFLRMQGVCAANFLCESMAPFFGSTIVVPRDVNDLEIENTAAFAMVSFDVSDNVRLTLEGRYQDESIDQRAIVQDLGAPADPPVVASAGFDGFLPRLTLDWRPTDNHLFYAAYAEGTKPGGFNSTVAIEAGLPTYEEEDARSFEAGVKSIFADGRLLANLAVFANELEGYQLTQNARSGQNTTSATVNAGDADINGLEAELAFVPAAMEGVTLRLNYAWTDAEYTAGADQNHGVLLDVLDDRMVNCSAGDQFPQIDGCTSRYGSISGKQVPRTAEHQLFADIEVRRPLAGGWEWYGGLSYIFESSKFAQVHNEAETGDTSLVNARFGFVSDRYSIRVWGRNLTGEDSAYNVIRYAEPEAFRRNFIVAPRRDTHFGVTLAVHW
ncbi:MAG: TonB-dependent receptor plug domain-containing protein [Gammaproteobacteria bacterium]|nr:TonB-dependent receptor plug domain-containing protein [Gammaproteobacteria bacterium]